MQFALWFLAELPQFLMAEPVCYFVGLAILLVISEIVYRILHITR